jgi:uncharacterized membrane protein YfcA
MAFTRLVLGWAAVMAFLVLWREVERRLRGRQESAGAPHRATLSALAVEAALLSLLAGLWFGSLGHGGATLVFLLVGALMVLPERLRTAAAGVPVWKPAVGGVLRIVAAGALLNWVLA